MPYPPQVFSLDGHAFGLTVSGVQIVDKVPTDLSPIRWDMPSATNNGGISFTVEDEGETALPGGAVVRLTDNVNNELLFAGPLVNVRSSRGAGPYRRADVAGTGWGFYLDNRAVKEWSWDRSAIDINNIMKDLIGVMVEWWGGPIQHKRTYNESGFTLLSGWGEDGTAKRTTVRGAVQAIYDALDWNGWSPLMYVDDEQQWHCWPSYTNHSAIVGTATSIGDQGALVPEYLSYEVGHENYAALAYVYDTSGDYAATVGSTTGASSHPAWEAGPPSITLDEQWASPPTAGDWGGSELYYNHGPVTSISFSTIEDTTYKPHMKVVVDDSLLTGGVAEDWYVESASGTIDARNVIELEVTLGARARSLVQTVAGG